MQDIIIIAIIIFAAGSACLYMIKNRNKVKGCSSCPYKNVCTHEKDCSGEK